LTIADERVIIGAVDDGGSPRRVRATRRDAKSASVHRRPVILSPEEW
jgi:hypothetical protein